MEMFCDWYLGQWSAREGIWEQQGRQQQGRGKVGMVLWLHIRALVSTNGTGSWSCEPAAPSMGLTGLFCAASCGLFEQKQYLSNSGNCMGEHPFRILLKLYKTDINRELNLPIKILMKGRTSLERKSREGG